MWTTSSASLRAVYLRALLLVALAALALVDWPVPAAANTNPAATGVGVPQHAA